MPIPDNQKTHAEIKVVGIITSGGVNAINTVNVFHYRRTNTVQPLTKASLDSIFQTAIVDVLALALNNRWTQVHNTVRFIDDAQDIENGFAHADVGNVAGDGMASIMAAYILLRTGVRGRHFRGSKHFGPLSESDTTAPNEDIFNAGALVLWGNVVTALAAPLADSNGNTWNLEVISTSLSQLVTNPTFVVGNDVTEVALNKRVGRLRRREAKSQY